MRCRLLPLVVALLAGALSLPAHAQAPAAPTAPTAPAAAPARLSVVFVNPGKTGEIFWELVNHSMRAAASQLNIDVETLWAQRNYRQMQELGLDVVNRATKPDYLVLVNEENAALPIMQAAESAGVKTMLLANALTGRAFEEFGGPQEKLKTWIASLVPDLDEAGARMARALVSVARARDLRSSDGKIHLLALGGDDSTPTSVARTNGLMRVVGENSDVVIDRLLFANWNETEAERLTANFLQWAQRRDINIAGVWAANDPMAFGAMNAAKRVGYVPGKDLIVVGLNWSPSAVRRVLAGEMLLTDGGHFMGGALSMMLLRDHADGCDLSAGKGALIFKTSPVTQMRANTALFFVGERQFEQLDFNKLRQASKGTCGARDFSVGALLDAAMFAGD
ncbi:MAG: sugar ABC transporter substrate-binding protein [Hyphomicrobiales bacterium]|nr:MAG: sugar ABC transporter substrate-binding protein [Hyphomicrobiales bacterium]